MKNIRVVMQNQHLLLKFKFEFLYNKQYYDLSKKNPQTNIAAWGFFYSGLLFAFESGVKEAL
jgi:hypothetical protein